MAQTRDSLHGSVSIEVDEQELRASLHFLPDEQGEEWTAQRITALARDQNISEGLDPAHIEELVSQWVKAKPDAHLEVIAQGQPPVLSEPGEIEWSELTVPEDLASNVQRILDSSPPPVVYERRTEKRKIEEKVKQTGLRALLKKEGTRVTYEKVEIKDPVSVAPEVVAFGCVGDGDAVAVIYLPEPGTAGINVFGRPIPPDRPVSAEVFTGDDLVSTGREIKTTAEGILRRGSNWANLIPFRVHHVSVQRSPDNATCLLDLEVGTPNADSPTAEGVYAKATALGFAREELLGEKELQRTLIEAIAAGRSLEGHPISAASGSAVELRVSEDRLRATLTLRKGTGAGNALSLAEIGAAIREAGLKGMNAAQVKQDIMEFFRGPGRVLEEYVLAEGKAPTPGDEGRIKWQAQFLTEDDTPRFVEAAKTKLDLLTEYSSLDEFPLSDVQRVAFVAPAATLASIEPPTIGNPGMDIYAAEIKGITGAMHELRCFENLEKLGNDMVSSIGGILEVGHHDEVVYARVRPHRNGEVVVRVSEHSMQATVSLTRHDGTGEPLTRGHVDTALAERGVVRGIQVEVIDQAFAAFESGEEVTDLPVAEGQPPQTAEVHPVTYHVELATGKSVTVDKAGKAHYRTQDKLTVVEKDQLIAETRISDPTGVDGFDVTGAVLRGEADLRQPLEAGANVGTEKADGILRFVAERPGELVKEGNVLSVRDVYAVSGDVGLETGNVRFTGSVVVKGGVSAGFTVFSGADLTVGGTVDSALLSAENTIRVDGGIKGGDKAVLRSKGEIHVAFAEQARLLSVGDTEVTGSALRCTIKCNGKLHLTSDKGNLVGGVTQARKGMTAANIGSERGAPTHVSFGQDYLIGDQIELEDRKIRQLRDRNQALDADMRQAEKDPTSNPANLGLSRREKLRNLKIIEKRTQRLFALKEKFEEHVPSEIEVRGSVYPGVSFESHGRTHEIRKTLKNVTLVFNTETGRIEEKAGAATPGE